MVNLPRASVFLRDKLFGRVVTVPTDQVDISFYKGKAKLAPYCSRFAVGTAVPRERQQLRLFSSAVHEAGPHADRGRCVL